MHIKQGESTSVVVYLADERDGSPLTGIVDTDIEMWRYRAGDLSAAQIVVTPSNFEEIDSVNMPGSYKITLSSEDTENVGQLAITIKENLSVYLTQTMISLHVAEDIIIPAPASGGSSGSISVDLENHIVLTENHPFSIHLGKEAMLVTDYDVSVYQNGDPVLNAVASFTELDGGSYKVELNNSLFQSNSDILLRFFREEENALEAIVSPNTPYAFRSYLGPAYTSDSGGAWMYYFLGSGSKLFLSRDSGVAEWDSGTSLPIPDNFEVYASDFDGTSLFVAGDAGGSPGFFVQHEGGPWDELSSGFVSSMNLFYDMSTFSNENVWLVASDGIGGEIVQWTLSGGIATSHSPSEDLRGIHVSTSSVIHAVGGNKIFRTTNGGSTWSTISTSVPGNFRAIHFDATGTVGIAVGTNGSASFSVDGGVTWDDSNFDLEDDFVSVEVASSTSWYLTSQTRSYKTINSGASWNSRKITESSGVLGHMWDHNGDMLFFGDSGTIYMMNDDAPGDFVKTFRVSTYIPEEVDLSPVLANQATIEGKVDSVQTTVDALENADLSTIESDLAAIKGVGFDSATDALRPHRLIASDVQSTVNALENTDLTPVLANQATIEERVDDIEFLMRFSSKVNYQMYNTSYISIGGKAVLESANVAIWDNPADVGVTPPSQIMSVEVSYDGNGNVETFTSKEI